MCDVSPITFSIGSFTPASISALLCSVFIHVIKYFSFVFVRLRCFPQGFLARAKGIPALELYRLAQKKKRKLVLCGHSLGGAVSQHLILW